MRKLTKMENQAAIGGVIWWLFAVGAVMFLVGTIIDKDD